VGVQEDAQGRRHRRVLKRRLLMGPMGLPCCRPAFSRHTRARWPTCVQSSAAAWTQRPPPPASSARPAVRAERAGPLCAPLVLFFPAQRRRGLPESHSLCRSLTATPAGRVFVEGSKARWHNMAQGFAVCPPTLDPVCLSPQSFLWQLLQALCSLRAARRWRRRAHWQFSRSITILNPYPNDKCCRPGVYRGRQGARDGGRRLAAVLLVARRGRAPLLRGLPRRFPLPALTMGPLTIHRNKKSRACMLLYCSLACWLDAASALMPSSRSGHQMHVDPYLQEQALSKSMSSHF